MQLKRRLFTQECLISSAFILIFLSNATSGNSLEVKDHPVLREQLNYFPFSWRMLKNVNKENAKPFYPRKPDQLDFMSYYDPTSSTAQHHNYVSSEFLDTLGLLKSRNDQFNRKLWEMQPDLSFDVSNTQHQLAANRIPLFETEPESPKGWPTTSKEMEMDMGNGNINPIKMKRDLSKYQRAMRIANGYRGFSRGTSNREVSHQVVNPISFWKTLIWQNGAKRNDGEGMTISVTHNLDILRRRLLKEIALRERQRTRKQLMMRNKGILGNIGK